MKTNITAPNYKGFRFPAEIISHAVGRYFRFSLSFRDIEELLAQRGITVTYETVRQWCLKFGQSYANELRRCRPRCGDKWHLDEVRQRLGHPCAESARQKSCQTLLSQAAQRVAIRPSRDH